MAESFHKSVHQKNDKLLDENAIKTLLQGKLCFNSEEEDSDSEVESANFSSQYVTNNDVMHSMVKYLSDESQNPSRDFNQLLLDVQEELSSNLNQEKNSVRSTEVLALVTEIIRVNNQMNH